MSKKKPIAPGPARHLQIRRYSGAGEAALLARGVGALLHNYHAAQPAAAPGRVGNKKPTQKNSPKKLIKNVFFFWNF
jgi:hypothetical protein